MQQTEKYKLNLIEPTDPFLPEALNQNTMKLEEAVSGHLEDMDQRVTVLEDFHIAYGYYVGDGNDSAPPMFIPLPFRPKALIINVPERLTIPVSLLVMEGYEGSMVTLEENGFTVVYQQRHGKYNYIAFG